MNTRQQRIMQRSKPYQTNKRLYFLALGLVALIALVLKFKLEGII